MHDYFGAVVVVCSFSKLRFLGTPLAVDTITEEGGGTKADDDDDTSRDRVEENTAPIFLL